MSFSERGLGHQVLYRQLAMVSAFTVIAIGTVAIVGMVLGIPLFATIVANAPGIKLNNALGLILLGVSIVASYSIEQDARKTVKLCASLAALLGGLTLIEYMIHHGLGIDQILRDPPSDVNPFPGRMPFLGALCQLLCGGALLYGQAPHKKSAWSVDWLVFPVLFISYISLLGYIYREPPTQLFMIYIAVPLPAAIGFFLLGGAILMLTPERGFISIFSSESAGGTIARQLMPVCTGLPPLLGLIQLMGQYWGLYDSALGTIFLVAVCVGVFANFIYRNSQEIDRSERERRQIYREIHQAKNSLEVRVQERTASAEAAANEARAAKEDALAANRAKSEFLMMMANEIRTPMNSVLGFAHLLDDKLFGSLNDTQRGFVEAILGGGQHLLNVIDKVLELSHIETGKVTGAIQEVEVLPVCMSVIASMTTLAEKYGVKLDIGDCGLGAPKLLTDQGRLVQCLTNFTSNAIKYNRTGGTVTFSHAVIGGDLLRIMVTDTGSGIPLDRQNELFQPFHRLNAEMRGDESIGVGLALTQRLASMLGGSVGFKSVPDQGSSFWIDIPCRESDIDRESKISHVIVPTKVGHKLLNIEDNAMNRELVRTICALLKDVSLIEAVDGVAGLEAARTETPDVILLDINLPHKNGFAVLRELREDPAMAKIPVIAVSANAMPAQIQQGLAAGFYRYLTKPVNVPLLLEAIESALSDADASAWRNAS